MKLPRTLSRLWTGAGVRTLAGPLLAAWLALWIGAVLLPCCQVAIAATPTPFEADDCHGEHPAERRPCATLSEAAVPVPSVFAPSVAAAADPGLFAAAVVMLGTVSLSSKAPLRIVERPPPSSSRLYQATARLRI